MGLRSTLLKTVARCTPQPMQHATFDKNRATSIATAVQQTPAIPNGIRANAATAIATAMQQVQKSSATTLQQLPSKVAPLPATEEKLHVAFASTRNTQLGGLTRHRLEKDLLAVAMSVCDLHGDSEVAREDMRRECMATPDELKPDLLEHFRFVNPQSRPQASPPEPTLKKATGPTTAPDGWRELAARYQAHHFSCKACCGAGQGRGLRCEVGSVLWDGYQSASS